MTKMVDVIAAKDSLRTPQDICRMLNVAEKHVASTEARLVAEAVSSGCRLAEALRKRSVVISPKSTVVCNRTTVAARIARALSARLGVAIQAARAAEDLGLETSGGGRRTAKTQRKRGAKGKKRAWRVAALVRKNKQAARLYATGVRPQANFGLNVQGAAPSTVGEIRRMAARAAAPPGRHSCTTAVIWWRLGGHVDPYI